MEVIETSRSTGSLSTFRGRDRPPSPALYCPTYPSEPPKGSTIAKVLSEKGGSPPHSKALEGEKGSLFWGSLNFGNPRRTIGDEFLNVDEKPAGSHRRLPKLARMSCTEANTVDSFPSLFDANGDCNKDPRDRC